MLCVSTCCVCVRVVCVCMCVCACVCVHVCVHVCVCMCMCVCVKQYNAIANLRIILRVKKIHHELNFKAYQAIHTHFKAYQAIRTHFFISRANEHIQNYSVIQIYNLKLLCRESFPVHAGRVSQSMQGEFPGTCQEFSGPCREFPGPQSPQGPGS